ncbi:hypothetical protein CRG98_025035 [Punica granatum]|uniref:Reverse transcriptase domain-containing protein n=1 Tax=Punica granatum TaxID=22663 RepID=A0A2I0JE41_PUNGR|nr:hypothetical protein CRG98_025035 [Punica granatum]
MWIGNVFTWSNKRTEDHLARKLDRVLINSGWSDALPGSTVEFLNPMISDHCPSLLEVRQAVPQRKRPFKFFNCWTEHGEYRSKVEAAWSNEFSGTPMFKLVSKLKTLKNLLRNFNNMHFSDISSRVEKARGDLEEVQRKIMRNVADSALVLEEHDKCADYIHLRAAEESFYKQKSKVKLLTLGDHNTAFFHRMAKTRMARNTTRVLVSEEGRELTDPVEIASEVFQFYTKLLGRSDPMVTNGSLQRITQLLKCRIPVEQQSFLISPASAVEVRGALWVMDDELMIFLKGEFSSVQAVLQVFKEFYHLSGLKLNPSKTEMFCAGLPIQIKVSDVIKERGWRWRNKCTRKMGVIKEQASNIQLCERADIIFCYAHARGLYTVTSTWNYIRLKGEEKSRFLWLAPLILRHGFITWLAIRNRLPTLEGC